MVTTTYKIEFNNAYLKDMKKIPPPIRKHLMVKISQLAEEPRPRGCKKLQGSYKPPLYRLRFGDYRVIYTIKDEQLLVVLIQIGHRREIYRD